MVATIYLMIRFQAHYRSFLGPTMATDLVPRASKKLEMVWYGLKWSEICAIGIARKQNVLSWKKIPQKTHSCR